VVAGEVLAGLEFVNRAAIRALGLTAVGYVQKDLGVVVPELHIGLGTGAKHAALGVEVFGAEFDGIHMHPKQLGTELVASRNCGLSLKVSV
jgi:hypothetical protein